ncbi:MAG: hypothetical protein WDZ41_04740 [Candidatus Babeliales bacterium]
MKFSIKIIVLIFVCSVYSSLEFAKAGHWTFVNKTGIDLYLVTARVKPGKSLSSRAIRGSQLGFFLSKDQDSIGSRAEVDTYGDECIRINIRYSFSEIRCEPGTYEIIKDAFHGFQITKK